MSSTPETTRSWLPPRQMAARSRHEREALARLRRRSRRGRRGTRARRSRSSRRARARPRARQVGVDVRYHRDAQERSATPRRVVVAVVLRQQLDALAGRPLRVVVLQRVDQLAHEERREVDAHDGDAGHLGVFDLVVDAREGDRELVVGVADVGEVRVHAGQGLRLDLDVEVSFLWLGFHAVSSLAR